MAGYFSAPREGDPCGTVYAVDVEPLMLGHIRKRAVDEGLENAVTASERHAP